MSLTGKIVTLDDVTEEIKQEMYQLMNLHYENVEWTSFCTDLAEKEWILLLKNSEDIIKGFTTLMTMNLEVDGQTVKGIFSGDTIIHRDYWGETELQRTWANFVLEVAHTQYSEYKVYWLLISKGYKTYRYLPLYFNSFYPRYDQPTPAFEKKLMDQYGSYKFPLTYDPETGIAYNTDQSNYYLKGEIAGIPTSKLNKPDIRFFAEQNPGYLKGDELICIANLSRTNLKPIALKLLECAV